MTGDRSSLGRATVIGSALLMCAAFVLALKVGPIPIDLWAALLSFGSAPNDPSEVREQIVLYDIRLPRAVLAVLVGGGLALSGALMQGLFRNPLAEPGIVGVSSGAAFAAIFVIVLGGSLAPGYVAAFGGFAIPVAAFFGSLITLFVLYGISTRSGQTSVATMLLAGIAITALANAATGIFVFISTD
ncbi:MAG: iron chelate uptake ABC transporter family permease subunit, partial [Pseudomonadota bacterium]